MSISESLGAVKEVRLVPGPVRYRETGAGPAIVFVHGIVVNGDLWRKVVPLLADRHRCITPDWPLGAHELPMNDDADLSPPALGRLVARFLAELDLDDVTLVGNDTGGAIAQLVAADHGERVGRLVLTSCDSFEHFFPPLFRYLQFVHRLPGGIALIGNSLRPRPLRRLPIALGWLSKKRIDRDVEDSYLRALLGNRAVQRDFKKVLAGVDRKHTLAAAEKLRSFRKPALIAWAADDKVFPVKDAERLAGTLPDARLELVEDSFTFVPEDQPERLAALIAEFAPAGRS
jgi:pimeloyl-ACP methyl ester carboxylesterase